MTLLKKNTCAAGNSRRPAAYALREKANSDQSVGAEIALVVKSIKAMSLFGYKARAASQDSQLGCARHLCSPINIGAAMARAAGRLSRAALDSARLSAASTRGVQQNT